jgi:multiple sugar transport system permease protein
MEDPAFLGALFLTPAVAYIIILVGIPFVLALAFSVTDVTVGNTSLDFVGLENFRRVWATPQFRRALANSFLFTVTAQLLVLVLANILALLLAQEFRGKWIARTLIMLPWATPIALGVTGWLWLLDSKFSPFDWILQSVGLLGPGTLLGPGRHMTFLGREGLAMASVIVVYVWRILPLAAVIILAGLTSIHRDLLDQAEVDGAGPMRIHFQISLPLILPIMSVALLFGLIFTFGDMVVVFILTRGGPVYYTQVLPVWAWFKGIDGGNLSEGAAIALTLFPVLLLVAILMLRLAHRTDVD